MLGLVMNLETQERLMVRTRVVEGGSIPTLCHLWKSADWAERETYDMFGVSFDGHPDMTASTSDRTSTAGPCDGTSPCRATTVRD